MRKAILAICMIFLGGWLSARAEAGWVLGRVDRVGPDDRAFLLNAGFAVIEELKGSLLLRVHPGDGDRLSGLGYDTEILCSDPTGWDFYLAGTLPTSDAGALAALGTVLYTEDNLLLIQVPTGTPLQDLQEAGVSAARLTGEILGMPRGGGPAPVESTRAPSPLVQKIADSVTGWSIDYVWQDIVPPDPPGTGTRHTTSPGCLSAAAYCYGVYDSQDQSPQYQFYKADFAPNVIGSQQGAIYPERVYLVTAHLDDMPSLGYAPGANDNASGSALVLRSAQALSCYAFKSTVKYINFTGEETGLEGSSAYATQADCRGEDIRGVLNMDMVAWYGDGEPSSGEDLDLDYDANSEPLAQFFAKCAADYHTGLPVNAFLCPSLHASDHYPFWRKGWPAVCGITDNQGYCGQGGNYPYMHSYLDTIENCGMRSFYYAVVKTTAAALAALAEPFRIAMDRDRYGCGAEIRVIVGDRDLNTSPGTSQTATAAVWSTTEPVPEIVALAERGIDSMLFEGGIRLGTGPPVHGDGILSAAGGDLIDARYVDARDCDFAANVPYTATALRDPDCEAPVLSGLQISPGEGSITASWQTDEPSDSQFGWETGGSSHALAKDGESPVTSHSVTVEGLAPCSGYRAFAASSDGAGNVGRDDNGGAGFGVTTLGSSYLLGPDSAEAGSGSWSVAGSTSPWHIDTCKAFTGTRAWKAGTAEGACPGQYPTYVTTDLASPVLHLSPTAHGTRLRWKEWYEVQTTADCYADHCRPQISPDGGVSWADLLPPYCGASGGWISREADLTAHEGSDVRLRFRFKSDGYLGGEGWYLDDIEVTTPAACPGGPIDVVASADPASGQAPLRVTFQGWASGGTSPLSYSWDFGDGYSASGSSATHAYAWPGSFRPVLTITDASGNSARDDHLAIAVDPAPCTLSCEAAVPEKGYRGIGVPFAATAQPSPECSGAPAFRWDFGDGASAAGPSAEHAYLAEGIYPWMLRVEADGIACVRRGSVAVTAPCSPGCGASAVPASGRAPLTTRFTAYIDTGGCTEPPAYSWEFGDGGTSTLKAPSHIYTFPGTYTWMLRVTEGGGQCSTSGTVQVTDGYAGDADGDGIISIGEVQQAVDMFLGGRPPANGVDCDSSGAVSIGELQRVIQGFLGWPSHCWD